MKILLIGGTGNIGTSITQQLVDAGHDLTIFTRTGKLPLALSDTVSSIQGNRFDYDDFETKVKSAGSFDCVIDMLTFSPQDAESIIRTFKGRTEQYIFTSTVDVYSKTGTGYPLKENTERNPSEQFAYAFNKAQCERMFEQADERGDFNVTIIRPAYTYSHFFVHSLGFETYFFDRMLKAQPIIVHGDGRSIWVATHSDDVARGYVAAVGNPITYGKAYHLTGEEWMTWDTYHYDLAQAIGAPEPTLVHIPTDLLARIVPDIAELAVLNFSHNNIFDNSAAKNELGYEYTIKWKDGARRGYEWLAERNLVANSDNFPFYDRIINAWQTLTTQLVKDFSKDI
ncbi:MAG: NAD-dependent epimerase/dehydratase family protein [Aggregatilineales bacterium]